MRSWNGRITGLHAVIDFDQKSVCSAVQRIRRCSRNWRRYYGSICDPDACEGTEYDTGRRNHPKRRKNEVRHDD